MGSAIAPRCGSARARLRGQGSDYYEHFADKLPFGSPAWWDQMVRESRGGNRRGQQLSPRARIRASSPAGEAESEDLEVLRAPRWAWWPLLELGDGEA